MSSSAHKKNVKSVGGPGNLASVNAVNTSISGA